MSERTQLILFFCGSTFFIVVFIAILLLLRRAERPETDVLLDAMDGVRAQQDLDTKNTILEHESLAKKMDTANGRLQFLMAKEIAEELEAAKADKDKPPEGAP